MSKEIFEQLNQDFEKSAVKTEVGKTGWKKGKTIHYIKYAHLVRRFNEVLGIDGWTAKFTVISSTTGKNHNDNTYWEVTGKIVIEGEKIGYNEAFGGLKSFDSEATAYKGAWSDAFKKCAALTGCGWSTYAGLLDPDSDDLNEPHTAKTEPKKPDEPAKDYAEQKSAWARCKELAKRVAPDDPWGYVVKFVQTKSPKFHRDAWQTFPISKVPKVEAALSEHIKKELDKAQVDAETGEIKDQPVVTKDQIKKLHVMYKKTFADSDDERRKYMQEITGKTSTKDLTKIEAIALIDALEKYDPTGSEWD
jgi:hypothetical protein